MIVEELKDRDIYLKLCEKIIGIQPPYEPPDIVIVAKSDDGIIKAFLSGYISYDNSFYIQYGGMLPEYQGKGITKRCFLSMLDSDITYVIAVDNTHTAMMQLLLSIGFIPFGSRYDNKGRFYIEWIRRA
jgi:hypothetical protein